jgi:fumarate hydratase class II
MTQANVRVEKDSLGDVEVPAEKLWGAQTQRSLEHFSIGVDLMPREMITAYAILKKGAANANHTAGRLDDERHALIVRVCDEILAGQHQEMFPLHVWMTGSGTQFNMNVNEVVSNRCCQFADTPLGSKSPVHPNDHVNMSQSSNDSFPSAMNIAVAGTVLLLRCHPLQGESRRCSTLSPGLCRTNCKRRIIVSSLTPGHLAQTMKCCASSKRWVF